MTGLPDFNYPIFNACAERWRKAGWTILNPAEHFEGRTDLERQLYMAADIKDLLKADGIALLKGWEGSKGALLEAAIAKELDLPFFDAESMAPIPTPHVAVVANVGTLESKIAAERGYQDPNIKDITTVYNAETEMLIVPISNRDGRLLQALIHIPTLEAGGYQFDGGPEWNRRLEARTAPQDLKAMTDKWVAFGTPDSISQEAHSLVYGDRNKAYGHPHDDYFRTSRLWEALLGLPEGTIGPYRAALMMALMKASRAAYQYKRDSLVDLAGYAECAHRIHRREVGEE